MSDVMVAREASFLNDSIDLKHLHNALKKISKQVIDYLLKVLEDEKIDPKVRVAAASKLLDVQVTVAEAISKDQIQRLIGEVRKGSVRGQVVDEDDRPLVDFGTVQQIS